MKFCSVAAAVLLISSIGPAFALDTNCLLDKEHDAKVLGVTPVKLPTNLVAKGWESAYRGGYGSTARGTCNRIWITEATKADDGVGITVEYSYGVTPFQTGPDKATMHGSISGDRIRFSFPRVEFRLTLQPDGSLRGTGFQGDTVVMVPASRK